MIKRSTLIAIIIVAWIVVTFVTPSGSGISCRGSECRASAGTSPLALGLGLVLFGAAWLVRPVSVTVTPRSVSYGQRASAFFVDVNFFVICFGGFMALPLLFAEAAHAGAFEWSYVRNFARVTDWILLPGSLTILLLGQWTWRRWLNDSNKPTLGQFIAGYTIVDGHLARFEHR